jgi:hypothetical protein
MAFLRARLRVIKEACEAYDLNETEDVLNDLKNRAWPRTESDLLNEIDESLLCGKLKDIIAVIEKYINTA